MAAGQCNGKQYYFIEMQYKSPKGVQWKKYAKFMWLSDATIDELIKAPMLQVLKILALPPAAAVDNFKLIRYKGEEIWP